MSVERLILSNLINNEDYGRKVIPFLSTEYFHSQADKVVYELINEYADKYNAFPGKEALLIDLDTKSVNDELYKECLNVIEVTSAEKDNTTSIEWLLDQTEKFCKDKAVYNAIRESIQILDDKHEKKFTKDAIPKILQDALAVSFDSSIGHDFIEDANARFDFYHRREQRLPFDLEYFNKITEGGLPNKTLNILLASTGVGKSMFMCHMAANNLLDHRNVLYITLELAEERVAERIDANLLDIPISDLKTLPKNVYDKKMADVKAKSSGKLIIKEYPTASAGSANFRYLLNELKIKRNFIPDIIYIDYLNICTSSRIKQSANANSYTIIKAIAEELRGLAVEFNVPIVSATQTNRGGFNNSDIDLGDTSESFGLPATADFMVALIATEELTAAGQIMVKQLKNRYADPDRYKRFVIGVEKLKMRLFDLDDSEQADIVDDTAAFDRTSSGIRLSEEQKERFRSFK